MNKEEILNLPASREMDALIGIKIMGLELWYGDPTGWNFPENVDYYRTDCLNDGEYYVRCPRYSTDISAAWEVAEMLRLSQGHPIEIRGDEWYDGGAWQVNIYHPFGEKILVSTIDETSGPHRTPPNVCLAICQAALLSYRL